MLLLLELLQLYWLPRLAVKVHECVFVGPDFIDKIYAHKCNSFLREFFFPIPFSTS